MKKLWDLSYSLSAQRRLWSDWADAQADLSLRWANTPFVGFYHVVAHIIPSSVIDFSVPSRHCGYPLSGFKGIAFQNELQFSNRMYKNNMMNLVWRL